MILLEFLARVKCFLQFDNKIFENLFSCCYNFQNSLREQDCYSFARIAHFGRAVDL